MEMEGAPKFNQRYNLIVKAVAIVTCFVALLVLTGWVTGAWVLTSVLPGMPTMKVNTAICFLFIGSSLWLLATGKYTALTGVLLCFVLGVGVVTSLQYNFHFEAGIDELLFRDEQTRLKGGLYPGRMANATAFSFTFLAVGLLLCLKTGKFLVGFAQLFFCAVMFIAFVALLGYIYTIPELYRISFVSTMSLHTSLLLVSLGFSATLLRPEAGIAALFLGRGLGSTVFRQLSLVMLLTALLFGYLRLYSFRNGVLPDEFGIALASLIYLTVGICAIGFSALRLNKIDAVRQQAENNLHELNANLEKLVEEKTRQTALAEVKFRRAFDYSSIGMALVSLEGSWLEVNTSVSKMLGYTPEELRQLTFQDITHPDDLDRDLQYLHKMLDKTIDTYHMEKRYIHKNGSVVWGLLSVSMLLNQDGTPYCFLSQIQDITTRKVAEQQMLEAKTRFEGAFNYSASGMGLATIDGRWMQVNPTLCNLFGYTEQEMYGLTFKDITHPDDWDSDYEQVKHLLAGEIESYYLEKRYIHKNGSVVWALLSASLLKDESGKPQYFLKQIHDITDRKIADEELKRVNRDLRAILDSGTQVSIISTDTDGLITHFSKGSETLLGYTAEEMEGKQTPAVIHVLQEVQARGEKLTARYGRPVQGFDVLVERARQGLYESREWTYVRKDGSTFPVQLVVTALKNEQNEVTGFLGIATDLTETKATQEAMRKVAAAEAKTRELEQFTYIASHDLQEPLRSLTSFTEMLHTNYAAKLDEQGRMMLEYSRNSAARMSELIQGLLFYSRIGQEKKLEVVDTDITAKQVMQDLAQSIKETGAVITTAGLPELRVYPVEFRLLLQNLVNNAIKFRRKDVAPQISITAQRVNESVHYKVTDNGIGIPEKDRQKVFILFKRLHDREDYAGTGIGLAHCKKIVEMHGGNIWIEANPVGGTIFNFTINT